MKRWFKRVRAAVVMGLTWAAVWAPVGVGTLPFLLGTPTSRVPLWVLASTVIGVTTSMSALSAAASLALARKAGPRRLPTDVYGEAQLVESHRDAVATLTAAGSVHP